MDPSTQPSSPQPTFQPAEQQPAPTHVSHKKRWMIVAIIVSVLLLVGLGIGAKVAADASAKAYTSNVKTHLDSVFAETSRTKRIELLEKPATLSTVPFGSQLSPTYAYAADTIKPAYDTTVTLARDAIAASRAYNESFKELIQDIQDALAISTGTLKANGGAPSSADFDTIETQLKNDLRIADMLDAAAEKASTLEVLNKAGNRDVIVKDLRDWATARREHLAISLAYLGNVTDWVESSLKDLAKDAPVSEYTGQTDFQILLDRNLARYSEVSSKTVDDLTASLDTLESQGYSNEVQKQLDEANKHFDELDVLLEKTSS